MEWLILVSVIVVAFYWLVQWTDWKSSPDNLTFKEWRKQQEDRAFDTYF